MGRPKDEVVVGVPRIAFRTQLEKKDTSLLTDTIQQIFLANPVLRFLNVWYHANVRKGNVILQLKWSRDQRYRTCSYPWADTFAQVRAKFSGHFKWWCAATWQIEPDSPHQLRSAYPQVWIVLPVMLGKSLCSTWFKHHKASITVRVCLQLRLRPQSLAVLDAAVAFGRRRA